ncbi:dihydroxyacetone kinase phosphoryl donor subunit DhaM [Timonella sp. A28]|uniref:dihydroxyacetone kinase phosphoryl donor subunit DhaM n=1 Tax=Timonella sp. A28 TaxID=3442640 RepID=UPI003EBC2435
MGSLVSLVLVSHSQSLAEGAKELASQMAPEVTIEIAGGLEDGSIGTSFDRISAAIEEAAGFSESDSEQDLHDVVVICDLGSAILSTESVLEFLPEELVGHVTMADAPFVEGSIAAAVEASSGASAQAVLRVANNSALSFAAVAEQGTSSAEVDVVASDSDALEKTVVIRNQLGLHARPAAVLARLIADFDAVVTLNDAQGDSVIEIMKLGITGGQELVVKATGNQAAQALEAVIAAVEEGFGEL